MLVYLVCLLVACDLRLLFAGYVWLLASWFAVVIWYLTLLGFDYMFVSFVGLGGWLVSAVVVVWLFCGWIVMRFEVCSAWFGLIVLL